MSQITKHRDQFNTVHHMSIAYMGTDSTAWLLSELPSEFFINTHHTLESIEEYLDKQSILTLPDVIIIEVTPEAECSRLIQKIKKNPLYRESIIILIASEKDKELKSIALKLKVQDFYSMPFPVEHFIERLHFLVKFKLIKPQLSVQKNSSVIYKLPLMKRIFDITVATICIIVLSPVLILTAILLCLDSKGPIINKSKRVGTGFSIFNFYRFRSMKVDEGRQLDNLSDLNIDDPRITRFGSLIRRTGIDQLPQLFNVLKGDMSLVGNRPLTLYEAEMLISNDWLQRSSGPAGITGLWQIKNRGKRDISERERKKFDNFSASNYSLLLDLEIMIKALTVKL